MAEAACDGNPVAQKKPFETPKRQAEPTADCSGEKKLKKMSPRSIAIVVEPKKLASILYRHLDEHETFCVGSYMKKITAKEPASISEILDWAPTLLLCLQEIPTGVASSKNFKEAFTICLQNRPLANPLLQKRLGVLFPRSRVIDMLMNLHLKIRWMDSCGRCPLRSHSKAKAKAKAPEDPAVCQTRCADMLGLALKVPV